MYDLEPFGLDLEPFRLPGLDLEPFWSPELDLEPFGPPGLDLKGPPGLDLAPESLRDIYWDSVLK